MQEECLSTALCMGLQKGFPISLFQVCPAAAELMAKFDTFVSFSLGCRFGEGLEDLLPNSVQLNAMSSRSKEPQHLHWVSVEGRPRRHPHLLQSQEHPQLRLSVGVAAEFTASIPPSPTRGSRNSQPAGTGVLHGAFKQISLEMSLRWERP